MHLACIWAGATRSASLEGRWLRLWSSNGIDLAPVVLYGTFDPVVLYGTFDPASGIKLERRIVQEPAAA